MKTLNNILIAISNWWFWLTYVPREVKVARLTERLFKRMLKGKGITLKQIRERIKTEPEWRWYQDLTWTQKEEDKFKKWAIKLTKRKLKLGDKYTNLQVGWFLMQWGLKVSDFKYDE